MIGGTLAWSKLGTERRPEDSKGILLATQMHEINVSTIDRFQTDNPAHCVPQIVHCCHCQRDWDGKVGKAKLAITPSV